MPYQIEYSPEVEEHLRVFSARECRIIFDTIDEQLTYQPTLKTKNRKPMRPNPLAPYELRIGNFRVFYDVVHYPEPYVQILAIGVKEHNVLRIGGKVIQV